MAMDRTEAGLIDADRDVAFHVSARAAAVFILVVAAGAVACRVLDAEQA